MDAVWPFVITTSQGMPILYNSMLVNSQKQRGLLLCMLWSSVHGHAPGTQPQRLSEISSHAPACRVLFNTPRALAPRSFAHPLWAFVSWCTPWIPVLDISTAELASRSNAG